MKAATQATTDGARNVLRWLLDNAHIDFEMAKKRKDRPGMVTAWLAFYDVRDLMRQT